MQVAAQEGHLEVLQWLRDRDCLWDEFTCAAQEGHLGVLWWAREHGCPLDSQTREEATSNGHHEVLR